jgi:hypothetical protein
LIPGLEKRKKPRAPSGAIGAFMLDPILNERLRDVSEKLQNAWLDVYRDSNFIADEIRKAHVWCAANPQRAPKKFGPFMTSWLGRAWERQRRSGPVGGGSSGPAVRVSDEELFGNGDKNL